MTLSKVSDVRGLAKDKAKQAVPSQATGLLKDDIRLHSSSSPGLLSATTYRATFIQDIRFPDPLTDGTSTSKQYTSTKDFNVLGSKYVLDPRFVDSVYPPPGHSAFFNVLPHIIFNDEHVPWSIEVDTLGSSSMALISFTEDELVLAQKQIKAIDDARGIVTPFGGPSPVIPRTPTLAINTTIKELYGFRAQIFQPVLAEDAGDETPIQIVPLQMALFSRLFCQYEGTTTKPITSTNPDIGRYALMSHVRTMDCKGTVSGSDTVQSVASIVSPRTGPLRLTQPATVHTHLVSLAGVKDMSFSAPSGLAALVSLYSWSYTCIPSDHYDVSQVLKNLGAQVQPFRNQDVLLNSYPNAQKTAIDDWVKLRSLSGYTLLRHRKPTGEPTIAVQRGLLTPVKLPANEFPPSDLGSDLAVVDEKTGLIDLTFQLAWELGRMTAMGDRPFSAAVMRLRKTVHDQMMKDSKFAAQAVPEIASSLSRTFITTPDTMNGLKSVQTTLQSKVNGVSTSTGGNRWQRPPTGTSSRSVLKSANAAIQTVYQQRLSGGIANAAKSVPSTHKLQAINNSVEIYNEANSPLSTDYASVLAWVMDRWFLKGLPIQNLIPEPKFIPQETIRTFYVDQSWFKAFIDGTLSLAEHFNETDDIREAIKTSLDRYLSATMPNGHRPQIPKWGFFLRSSLVQKFPKLRVSAPFTDANDTRTEVLRCDVIDSDLLLALFDREPGLGFFPQGITIGPPPHQGVSMFGTSLGITEDTRQIAGPHVISKASMSIPFKHAFTDFVASERSIEYNGFDPLKIYFEDPTNGLFDYNGRLIAARNVAATALSKQPDSSVKSLGSTAALLGSQLLTITPELVIREIKPAVQAVNVPPSTLSTSKDRPSRSRDLSKSGVSGSGSRNLRSAPATTIPNVSLRGRDKGILDLIGRTDLQDYDVANERGNLFSNYDTIKTVAAPVANNTGGGGLRLSYLNTRIYNLTAPFYNTTTSAIDYLYTTAVYAPTSAGFLTDLHITTTSVAPTNYATGNPLALTTFEMSIPIGTASNCLLAPFPTVSSAPPLPSAPDGLLFSPRVNTTPSFTPTDNLPNIRFVGLCPRWTITPIFYPSTAATASKPASSSGYLRIILDANVGYTKSEEPDPVKASRWWDIRAHRDLSIVIEDVKVNWFGATIGSTSSFEVHVEETYCDPARGGVGSYTIGASVGVTVQAKNQ